jgi:hypothetical protein
MKDIVANLNKRQIVMPGFLAHERPIVVKRDVGKNWDGVLIFVFINKI